MIIFLLELVETKSLPARGRLKERDELKGVLRYQRQAHGGADEVNNKNLNNNVSNGAQPASLS